MFKAKHSSGVVYKIYAVQQLEDGLTQFLIYHEGARNWLWWSALDFDPYEQDEY
jgi:hypothetical protein